MKMTTKVAPELMQFYKMVVQLGPMIKPNGKSISQREINQCIAIVNRIDKGTASESDQEWFNEWVVAVEASRKPETERTKRAKEMLESFSLEDCGGLTRNELGLDG